MHLDASPECLEFLRSLIRATDEKMNIDNDTVGFLVDNKIPVMMLDSKQLGLLVFGGKHRATNIRST